MAIPLLDPHGELMGVLELINSTGLPGFGGADDAELGKNIISHELPSSPMSFHHLP